MITDGFLYTETERYFFPVIGFPKVMRIRGSGHYLDCNSEI